MEVSNSTGIAADAIAESYYEALSSGIDDNNDFTGSMGFITKAATLAKGGFTDITSAVDVTTSVINAYGKGLEDVDSIQKILVQTQNLGKTTVDALAQSLSGVTPTAAALGVNFKEVGASLSVMTSQGTPTSEAVTSLNSLLAELADTGSNTSNSLKLATESAFGSSKSFSELQAEGYSLSDIMTLISDYAGDTGVSLYDLMGSQEAVSAALQIGGDNANTYKTALDAMNTSVDVVGKSAAEAGNTTSTTLGKSVNETKNKVIEFYQNAIQPLLLKLSEFANFLLDHEDLLAIIAIAIGTITVAVLAYNIAMGIAAIVTNATLWPIILIVAAIALLAVGIYLLIKHWDDLKAAAGACWDWIVGIWNAAAGWFNDSVIQPIVGFFSGLWDGVVGIFQSIINWVKDNWKSIVLFILNPFAGVFNYLYEHFAGFRDFVNKVVNSIGGFFSGLWDGIKGGFVAVVNMLINGLNTLIEGILYPVNGLIKGWNSTIGKVAGTIPTITLAIPNIPKLAAGAVIPPNREFIATLGDQKSGMNIETPEALLRKIMQDELDTGTLVDLLQKLLDAVTGLSLEVKLYANDREIAKSSNRGNNSLGYLIAST